MDESEAVPEVELTERERVDGWRLLNLIDAYRKQKEPLDLEDIELLGFIAHSSADLHLAVHALEHGCAPDQLVDLMVA